MKLVKVKLKNFRGYKNFEVRFDSDFNVVIGRNIMVPEIQTTVEKKSVNMV